MDRDGWNQRYETTELVWTAEPNQFLVAEVEGSAPGMALLRGFDLVAELPGSGLLVENAERVPRPVTTEDGPRVAIDAIVRARRQEVL